MSWEMPQNIFKRRVLPPLHPPSDFQRLKMDGLQPPEIVKIRDFYGGNHEKRF
jgi:hypothetical protein